MKLLIFDVNGVFRDSSLAVYEGFKRGFEAIGLDYKFTPQEVWHLRGIGKYNSSKEAIKALLAIQKSNQNLDKIIENLNAEEILDNIVREYRADTKIIEKIREEFKKFFKSEEARKLIKVFPYCEKAINKLSKKIKNMIFYLYKHF